MARLMADENGAGAAAGPDDLRSTGDPMVDYIGMWRDLEAYHDTKRLTGEAWSFLGENLQRPLELRIKQRRPASLDGALAALDMAIHLLRRLDKPGPDQAWYRELRLHLVETGRDYIATHVLDPGQEPRFPPQLAAHGAAQAPPNHPACARDRGARNCASGRRAAGLKGETLRGHFRDIGGDDPTTEFSSSREER